MKNKNNYLCKLLYLNNDTDFKTLILSFVDKYYYLDNKNFEFNNSICNIEKNKFPSWKSKCFYKTDILKNNTTQYRIILYKFDELTVYLEVNGLFKLFDDIIKNFDKIKIKLYNKDINTPEKLKHEISLFLLNKDKEDTLNKIKST
jgi:hypothetical protein